MSPLSSSMIAPASDQLASEFGERNTVVIAMYTSIFVLAYGACACFFVGVGLLFDVRALRYVFFRSRSPFKITFPITSLVVSFPIGFAAFSVRLLRSHRPSPIPHFITCSSS